MKNMIRGILGFAVVAPFAVSTWFLSLFIGRTKAIVTMGPLVTLLTKQTLRRWVPRIDGSKDFDSFSTKMRNNFWIWKPFYDIEITEDNNNVFKLRISSCPFCEVLNSVGLSGLSPYVCYGDWAIAKDNADKWIFERNHQIGTGDSFCDHTYKRLS